MFVVNEEKKKVSVVKIIVVTAAIAAGVAAIVTALMIWKKKKCIEKQLDEEIEAAIDAAFAEDEAKTAEIQINEVTEA